MRSRVLGLLVLSLALIGAAGGVGFARRAFIAVARSRAQSRNVASGLRLTTAS